MKTKYGLPIVTFDNIWEVIGKLGLKEMEKLGPPVSVEEHMRKNLTSRQQRDLKYLLQLEVVDFSLSNGEIFSGCRMTGVFHGTRVLTILEDNLVPICAEFQQGSEEILLDLPGGVTEPGEDIAICAKREFEEETGIGLNKVVSLGQRGMPVAARHIDARNYSFLGMADNPPKIIGLNQTEESYNMRVVLTEINDWLKMIDSETVQSYSAATTLLALRRMKETHE